MTKTPAVWQFLSEEEVAEVRAVLRGLLEGPWLQNKSAFWARLGFPRSEISDAMLRWPDSDLAPIVIRRAMVEVALGIRKDEDWEKYFGSLSKHQAERLLDVVSRHVDAMGNWIGSGSAPDMSG